MSEILIPTVELLPPSDVADGLKLRGHFLVEKFEGDGAFLPDATPYEVAEAENLFVYGGVSCLWQCLIGNGGSGNLTYFNNANAAIGVGDSTTTAAAGQTDLQASTNKLRVGMNATYPQHTDAVTSGAASIIFQSTFSTSQANWAWQELGVFNSATAATNRMLDRVVSSLGTKTSASSWQVTATLSIA